MRKTIVRKNERSWAIDLITVANQILTKNNLFIKKVGGESTISTNESKSMFPDVILYGDLEQTIILQGWELKMPDVAIEDEAFVKDAQRKARALNLNSCLIWNFTYAVLYVKDENDKFNIVKQWNDTNFIHTREDVFLYRKEWESLLENILFEVNEYFLSGTFRNCNIGELISEQLITELLVRNKKIVSEFLRSKAVSNSTIDAYISSWWSELKDEYDGDEEDMYLAFSKNLILNWTNKIIFAHLIKKYNNDAKLVDLIDYETSPDEANKIFNDITTKCDFYNIFSPLEYSELIPEIVWNDFLDLSTFLKENGILNIEQSTLQFTLENTINVNKRLLNGQFTTPEELAKILIRLSVRNWNDNILDCCCGTGTIPNMAIRLKEEKIGLEKAIETVWACDKYQYPLQVANISMTRYNSINIPNRLFKHNALTLREDELIRIVNPKDGTMMNLKLPTFGAIIANFPFIKAENIPIDDKKIIENCPYYFVLLDGRADLYSYIALKVKDILKENGILGIITSNSWLGTSTGKKFVDNILLDYNIEQVHISGKGKWFKNADVVATILILKKKNVDNDRLNFYLWKKDLKEIENNIEYETCIINSALLGKSLDNNVIELNSYSLNEFNILTNLNLSYNAFFHKIKWIIDIKDKLIKVDKVFEVFRGSRRGWDSLFYPKSGEHRIEKKYIKKVLINARNIEYLDAVADNEAFCCDKSMEVLKMENSLGTIEWIKKFENQTNSVGKPLPEVLSTKDCYWYQLKDKEIAEFFTGMNPEKRIFFAKFDTPSFVNQRLIGLKQRKEYNDIELNFALLNSILMMFFIEASGFGRGLGVLDISKDSISNCYMINPKLINNADREKILNSFKKIRNRKILSTEDELNDPDRIEFEQTIFSSLNISCYYENVKESLLSMQRKRLSVKNN